MAVSDASCSEVGFCCWKASDGDNILSSIAPGLIGKTPVSLKPPMIPGEMFYTVGAQNHGFTWYPIGLRQKIAYPRYRGAGAASINHDFTRSTYRHSIELLFTSRV